MYSLMRVRHVVSTVHVVHVTPCGPSPPRVQQINLLYCSNVQGPLLLI